MNIFFNGGVHINNSSWSIAAHDRTSLLLWNDLIKQLCNVEIGAEWVYSRWLDFRRSFESGPSCSLLWVERSLISRTTPCSYSFFVCLLLPIELRGCNVASIVPNLLFSSKNCPPWVKDMYLCVCNGFLWNFASDAANVYRRIDGLQHCRYIFWNCAEFIIISIIIVSMMWRLQSDLRNWTRSDCMTGGKMCHTVFIWFTAWVYNSVTSVIQHRKREPSLLTWRGKARAGLCDLDNWDKWWRLSIRDPRRSTTLLCRRIDKLRSVAFVVN